MLEAAITEKLLILEARRRGMGNDPRIEWAVTEEQARLQLAAELERRVPEREVADDEAALRAYYEAHIDEFTLPEKRSADLIKVESADEAEALIAKLAGGEVTWEEVREGDEVYTPTLERDDERFPLFHRYLFDPKLGPGDVVPVPVYAQLVMHVASVREIVPAKPKPMDDPRVRAALIEGVRAPRLEAARQALMAELAERYPVKLP